MPFGLLTGLGAALAWGTLDIVTALTSRVIGSLRVTAGMQLVTAVLFIALFLVTGTALPTDPGQLAMAALLGLIGAGAYLAYFTGLQIGPIAVVSGIVAAFGGLTVVLSVVFRGETLTALQAVGATVATVGVVLTGVAFDGGWRVDPVRRSRASSSRSSRSILFALMTMATDIALETMSAGSRSIRVARERQCRDLDRRRSSRSWPSTTSRRRAADHRAGPAWSPARVGGRASCSPASSTSSV